MRSTFRKRNFVVHLFGWHKQSAFQTLLTEWMCLDIAISDSFPSSAVPTAYSRVSVVLLVAFGFLFCVFLAEPSVRQLGATGERARSLWFPWHSNTSFWV